MIQIFGAKIERNAIILFLTEVLIKVLGLGLSVAIARILGVEKFGLLGFAYSLSSIWLLLPAFGFNRLTVRELARRPIRASRFLTNISAIKGALILPIAGFCVLTTLLTPQGEGKLFVVFIVFLVVALQQHILFACSFFRAMQKMEWEALVRLILAGLIFLSGLAVLFLGFGIKTLMVSRLALAFICLVWAFILIKEKFAVSLFKASWRYSKVLLKMSFRLAILDTLGQTYGLLNLVILGFIKGDMAVGYYSAAFGITAPFYMLPVSVVGASFPVISKYWDESSMAFHSIYRKCMRYILILAIPLAVGIFLLGEKTIILLYGRDYLPSVAVIRILAVCLVPDFLNYIQSTILVSMNREKTAVTGAAVGAVVGLGCCIIFIPRWGAVGAAFAWLVSESAVFLCQFLALYGELRTSQPVITAVRACLAAALMGLILAEFLRIGVALPFLVSLSVLIYFVSLLILREIRFNELIRGYQFLRNLDISVIEKKLP